MLYEVITIAGRFPHNLTSDKLADRIRGVFLERAG